MATSSRNLTRTTWLPPGASAFLRRRGTEALGLLLAVGGLAAALALVSYQPGDPSLNAATGVAAVNLLGATGALFADVTMQSIGAAGWFLSPLLLAWGWRVGMHRGLGRLWLRLSLFPIALLLWAVALAGP